MLEHAPHGIDIVPSESPVTLSIEIAETNFGIEPELDSGDTISDLAGYEFEAAARALMIEKNSGASVHSVTLSVIHRDPVSVEFRYAVGAARIERRRFFLRDFNNLSEHLR